MLPHQDKRNDLTAHGASSKEKRQVKLVCSPKTGPAGMLVSWNVRESRPERLRTTVRFLSSKMEVRKSSAELARLPDGSHQEVL